MAIPSFFKEIWKLAGSTETQLNLDFSKNQEAKGETGEGLTIHNIPCDDWWITFFSAPPRYNQKTDAMSTAVRINPIKEGNLYRVETIIESAYRKEMGKWDTITVICVFFENENSDGSTFGGIVPAVSAMPSLTGYDLETDVMPIAVIPLQILEGNLFITKTLTVVCLNFSKVL